jgi:hypothetical protein
MKSNQFRAEKEKKIYRRNEAKQNRKKQNTGNHQSISRS